MIKVKTISTAIKKGVQWITVQVWGPSDKVEAPVVAPFGVDSSPIPGMTAILGNTAANGINNIIGYINTGALAETGEIRIYSTDSSGETQAYVWAKVDGTVQINGDTDYAVLFNKLKIEFNEMKGKLNSFISLYNAHVHPGVTTGPGVSGITTSIATASAANIDNAKNDLIRTNG